MKEFSIEEKAKRYDEVIEKFKVILNSDMVKDGGIIFADNVRKIFPELKESEDEKIRKELYKYFSDLQLSSDSEFSPLISIDEILSWLEKQGEPQDKGEISDGYHTFNELYYYRMLYNAAFFNMLPKEWVHKSKKHNDGEDCFGGGWFIVMANLPTGQISNHYELKDWNLFQIPEKEVADKWDGHTPQEAADRLYKYLLKKQSEIFPIHSNSSNIGKDEQKLAWREDDQKYYRSIRCCLNEFGNLLPICNNLNKKGSDK